MDANTQIENIISSISSIQDTINELQSTITNLNIVHKEFIDTHNINENESDNKISNMKSELLDKVSHVENVISNTLDSEKLQHRLDFIKKIEDKKNYWNDKLKDQNGRLD